MMNRLIHLTYFLLIGGSATYAQVSPALKITPATRNTGDFFGTGVSIDGTFCVSGSPKNDQGGANAGIAHVFERNNAGNWNEIQTLLPEDLQPGDLFGSSVVLSGNYLAVSAPLADALTPDSTITDAGAVYIFERNQTGAWIQTARISPPDAHADDRFGVSVALSGKYLVVGSYSDYDANGANYIDWAGAAYVFERTDGGTWLPVQKLTALDRAYGDSFSVVAVDGYTKTIVVGATGVTTDVGGVNPVPYAGAIYVFRRDGSGNWNQMQKLTASVRHNQMGFGSSVAISGNWILAGAPTECYDEQELWNEPSAGAVYLFEDNGGTWSQKRKIVSEDLSSSEYFGKSVALAGHYALVGSESFTDENGINYLYASGAAYLFERTGTTWSLKKKLLAPDRSHHDKFGSSVSISGSQIMVGAEAEAQANANGWDSFYYGSAYIFTIYNPLETETQDLFSVHVYPNPTQGDLTIYGDETITGLTLMDLTGKIISQTPLSKTGVISYSIDQPQGIYLLKINAGESFVIKKIRVN